MLLGAVGQLQFEVVQHRLMAEYSVDIRLMPCRFVGARWITADTPEAMKKFTDENASKLALDAADTLAYMMTLGLRPAPDRRAPPANSFPPAARACRPEFVDAIIGPAREWVAESVAKNNPLS